MLSPAPELPSKPESLLNAAKSCLGETPKLLDRGETGYNLKLHAFQSPLEGQSFLREHSVLIVHVQFALFFSAVIVPPLAANLATTLRIRHKRWRNASAEDLLF